MTELTTAVHHSITAVKRGEWNAIVAQQSDTGSVFERYEWLAAHEAAVFDAIADRMASLTSGRTIGHLFRPASGQSLRYATRLRERGYFPSVRDCRFVLNIDRPWDDVAMDLSQKKRRNLRKADEAGVTATDVPVTPDSIEAFGRRHAEHMDRLDGDGASPALLASLLEHVGDRLKLFRATVDGTDAGELLTVLDDERETLVLLFPAYDPTNFSHYPSEVLYRAAIRWGIDAGYTTCDFGETTPDFEDGTFSFKTDFGGQAQPTLRWERIDSIVGRVLYLLGSDRAVSRLFGR